MKVTIPLIVALMQTLPALSAAVHDLNAAAVCGSLGVMSTDPKDYPAGTDMNKVRLCRDHPIGDYRDLSAGAVAPKFGARVPAVSTPNAGLTKRTADACWKDSQFGCTKGYCWKVCGNEGEWCWTAYGDGSGPWKTCGAWSDCSTNDNCGIGGKSGGCSC